MSCRKIGHCPIVSTTLTYMIKFFLGSFEPVTKGNTMSTQIQTVTATNEVTVNLATGEAYISNRKLAKELGLDESTTRKYFSAQNISINQGVSAENMLSCTQHYAQKGYTEAINLLIKISQAGAKAYLYNEAGLSIGVTQQRPLTQLEAYEELVRMEKTRLALLDTVGAQQKVINHKNIKTDCSDTHFTIKRIRALNQGMKIDPKILLKVSEQLESDVESVYGHYDQSINQYSREVWEEAYPDAFLPD